MKSSAKSIAFIIGGNLLLAFAVGFFLIPYDILSGGVVGVAVVLKSIFPFPTEMIANALVLGLFFIGWLVLGKKFALQTGLSSFIYPIFLTVIVAFVKPPTIEPLMASFYGGLIAGVGIGLVIRTGASTGGMDIPPLIIHRYTKIPVATLILMVDACTVALGLWAYDLEKVLIGFVAVFTTTFAISKILSSGGAQSKSIQIISEKYQEISQLIHDELDRGTTLLNAQGGYTQEEKKVLLVVVSQKEYNKVIELVNKIDEKAFLIATDATDVHGEGFSFGYRV
ncbi:MAG: YitT family protein [Anaerorhabdus sp.]